MSQQMSVVMMGRKTAVSLLVIILLLAGCRSMEHGQPNSEEMALVTHTAVPTSAATITPSPTPTSTATPSPTFTPSPTPAPTATAVSIHIVGGPRTAILNAPQPENNAICGIVDTLDFPLDPPEALSVSYGGQDFGQYRGRYDLYHAGEDWQLVRGRSNLGVPVYAIGHGRVTYAQPNGWGRDKGVIIIRHTFADGSSVLSFYGHMEPDSVMLQAGDCVVRGQKIAEIGQPRTPPHLHFEIRTHMPDTPGPGYWSTDPTSAGWLPPSQFIWEYRMKSNPGVVWTRPFTATNPHGTTLINETALIALEDGQLIRLDEDDGTVRWRHAITETVTNAIMSADHSLLYTADRRGKIAVYPLLEDEEGAPYLPTESLWTMDLEMFGFPTLLPLPDGGVVLSVWNEFRAVSADGTPLWQNDFGKRPFDWLLTDDQLILTFTGRSDPIYALTASGWQEWAVEMNGRPIQVGDDIWYYAREGVYRLDPATQTTQLLYQLPPSFLGMGSIIALPAGGALIAHQDLDDSRLIRFDAAGTVQWERSYASLDAGSPQLLLHAEQPYLLLQSDSSVTMQLDLYTIDQQNSTLHHIFTGGTRQALSGDDWVVSINDALLLVNVGGGSMTALDGVTAVSLTNPAAN